MPQQIDPYVPPPSASHAPVLIDIDSANPRDALNCLDASSVRTAEFRVDVHDADRVPLTERWFLNAEARTPSSRVPIYQPPSPLTSTNGSYLPLVITERDLGLERHGPGIYALEVVVSDGFDPDTDKAPTFRAIQDTFNIATHKWVINYVGSGSCAPQ